MAFRRLEDYRIQVEMSGEGWVDNKSGWVNYDSTFQRDHNIILGRLEEVRLKYPEQSFRLVRHTELWEVDSEEMHVD